MKNDALRTQRSAVTDRPLSAVVPVRAHVTIAGVGVYLPTARLSSDEVQSRIAEISGLVLPDGLVERITGIASRPLMDDDEQCSTLAAAACQDLFTRTGVDPDSIDLLIFASASRDMVEPATSHAVQDLLGTHAHCFDVTNACNSLLNAIDVASAMLAAGRASRALVCAGEAPSRGVRWDIADLDSLVDHFAGFTFGDAGSAVLLARADDPVLGGDCPGAGITYLDAVAHSEHWKVGGLFGGGSRHPRDPEWTYFRGDGRHLLAAFEEAGDAMLRRTLEATGTTYDDYRHILVHQVTQSYVDKFCATTGVPADRLVPTVARYGNMAAATLGVQLAEVYDTLVPGDRVLFIGLGGGISLATMVWQR
jgi:3-oxoacyl-[acyl-carrier-protein] synthase-3